MVTQPSTTDAAWKALTPDQKQEKRFEAWLAAPGITFASKEAEKKYKERATNIKDALQLKKRPARVPVIPTLGGFGEAHCGYSHGDLMYDVNKVTDLANRCTLDFDLDVVTGANIEPGSVYEAVDFKLYVWPGHGLPAEADGIQFVESDYMKPEEYDAFIKDPTYFWDRYYLPRVLKIMEPLQKLYPLCGAGATSTIPSATISAYGQPDVAAALEKMIEAGKQTLAWQQKVGANQRRLNGLGYPSMNGGTSKAPLDLIGDSMRGFNAIIADMYRRPQKLMDAMDALVPIMIRMGVETARMGNCPLVGFALHKGADGFMSDKQFKEFYWAPLKKIILGLIEEGLIPRLGAQGGYNDRLEVIRDIPKGKVLWAFGQGTDMAKAKEIVGDVSAMTGNVPASLIQAGSKDEIQTEIRDLIKVAGKGGGYLFSTAQGVTRTSKLENVKTMIDTAKKYAAYN